MYAFIKTVYLRLFGKALAKKRLLIAFKLLIRLRHADRQLIVL